MVSVGEPGGLWVLDRDQGQFLWTTPFPFDVPEFHVSHIDVETGKVVEFVDPELEALQKQIAEKLGYRLVDHRMELYGVRLERDN